MKTITYRGAARALLDQALTELAEGDTRQASEKGWGAAAQMIKAVASSRDWKHRSHAALYKAVDRIVAETGDRSIGTLFRGANGLHQNFYENWGAAEYVTAGLGDVGTLLDKLEPLLE